MATGPEILMLDCSGDSRGVLPVSQAAGLTIGAVARYLQTGAPGSPPVATPLTQDEVAWLHGQGLPLVLIDNGEGYGAIQTYAEGQANGRATVAAAQALGAPSGALIWIDLETWAATVDHICGAADAIAGAGYRPGIYGSALAAWRGPFAEACQRSATVAAMPVWTARYIDWSVGQPLPAWAPGDSGGDKTVAWQFTEDGPGGCDLSLLRLPLAGLWTPDGTISTGGDTVAEAGQAVDAWAQAAWEKAKAKGVMDGTRPQDPVRREELAVILDRLGLLK